MKMYRTQETGFRINNPRTKLSFFSPFGGTGGPNYRLFLPVFPPPFLSSLLPDQRSWSRSSLADCRSARRSSRVSRFSHKTCPTGFDRCQSAIIIRVPADPRSFHDRVRSCYLANLPIISPPRKTQRSCVRWSCACLFFFFFYSLDFLWCYFSIDWRLKKSYLRGHRKILGMY